MSTPHGFLISKSCLFGVEQFIMKALLLKLVKFFILFMKITLFSPLNWERVQLFRLGTLL